MKRLLLVVAVVVLLVGADSVPVRSITNGDFEGGTAAWSNWSTIIQALPGARTGGSGYFYLNINSIAGGGVYQTETGVDPGETWKIDGWIRVRGGTYNFGWYQTFSPYNPGPNNISSGIPGMVWTQVSVTQAFTSTSDDGYRDVQCSIGGGAQVDLDDISTSQVTNVDDWCFY